MNLKDVRAIVTGGAAGMGAHFAQALLLRVRKSLSAISMSNGWRSYRRAFTAAASTSPMKTIARSLWLGPARQWKASTF